MDFLTDSPKMVLFDWLSQRVGLAWSTDFTAIGRVKDGEIVGVVGYNNFTGTACQMHMAGDGKRWVNRYFLNQAFWYPFEGLKLDMVFGVVPSGNQAALKMDLKLGFKQLMYIPGAHPDGGLHYLQMTRADCRWIRGNHRGQEINAEAA